MSRIQLISTATTAAGNKLLIPYLVAGDPNLETTLALMHDLVERGADIIELGIPFSDPSADGPVIQRGVERALAGGTTLQKVLELVAIFRRSNDTTAIVLMGYLNPIEIMGYKRFVNEAAKAGIDGVLIVDMPPSEANELHDLLHSAAIDVIFLVAPTTSPHRAKVIASQSAGYLYYVSLKGVTGAAISDFDSIRVNIEQLRKLTDLPIVIGFGIKDRESAKAMAELSDGVIIGSALVEQIEKLQAIENKAAALADTAAVISIARQAIDEID